MKIRKSIYAVASIMFAGMVLTACSDDDSVEPILPGGGSEEELVHSAYILYEGSWGGNNAGLSCYSPYGDAEFVSDLYFAANSAKMGDLANDMTVSGGNIYIAVNGSKYVARLDLSGKEQARYSFNAEEGAPRCIDVENGSLYVTQYGGKVSKLDAVSLEKSAEYKGGDNLEGIAEENGKLYVSNGYKVDGSGNYVYNNQVIVVNALTMQEVKTIEVVQNPERIYEINDKIYVLSKGNYIDVDPALQVIDPKTDKVTHITNASKITEGNGGLIYCVRSAYDENWNLKNEFFTYNPTTGNMSESSFLKNAPETFATAAIYMLEVDEENGDIYVGTSDYVTTGTIYRFDKNGELLSSFDAGGINPSKMCFSDLD